MLIFNVVSWNGVLVRAMRDAKGLDKQGFAALIGVSGTAVAKWEMDGADAGLSHAPQLKLDHILNALDTDARTRFTQLATQAPTVHSRQADQAETGDHVADSYGRRATATVG